MAASTSNGKRSGPLTGDALTTITTLSPFVKSAAGVNQHGHEPAWQIAMKQEACTAIAYGLQ